MMQCTRNSRPGVCLLLGALLVLSFDLAAQDDRAAGQATRPPDPWAYYVIGGRWLEGQDFYRRAIIETCADVHSASERELFRLHYGWMTCVYLPAIERTPLKTSEQLDLARWLLRHDDFAYDLFVTIRPADDPPRVMEIVEVIRQMSASRALRYKPLTIAFAVVWDGYAPDNRPLREAFDFFADNAGKMRMDPRHAPVALLKYVVDSQRPREEREWALRRFRSVSDLGRIYEMPPYDLDAFLVGKENALAEHDYTLDNILRYGGVCHDRAVFASEVGKATGTPCTYITGQSISGIGHAWIGYLRRRGRGYVWDRDSGRIGDEDVTFGRVLEPQEGVVTSEYEPQLSLRALETSDETCRRVRLWLDVAGILADAGLAQSADALSRSLDAAVLDRGQWLMAARLASKGLLSPDGVERVLARVTKALQKHPSLAVDACGVLLASLPSDEAARRVRLLKEMRRRFEQNILATGRLRLIEGRELERQGRVDDALGVYAEAAPRVIRCKEVGLALLDNAARLLLARRRLKQAIALHEKVYHRAPEIRASAYVPYATRFAVGVRWAKLHLLAGDEKAHRRVIGSLVGKYRSTARAQALLSDRLMRLSYDELNTTSAPVTE